MNATPHRACHRGRVCLTRFFSVDSQVHGHPCPFLKVRVICASHAPALLHPWHPFWPGSASWPTSEGIITFISLPHSGRWPCPDVRRQSPPHHARHGPGRPLSVGAQPRRQNKVSRPSSAPQRAVLSLSKVGLGIREGSPRSGAEARIREGEQVTPTPQNLVGAGSLVQQGPGPVFREEGTQGIG